VVMLTPGELTGRTAVSVVSMNSCRYDEAVSMLEKSMVIELIRRGFQPCDRIFLSRSVR